MPMNAYPPGGPPGTPPGGSPPGGGGWGPPPGGGGGWGPGTPPPGGFPPAQPVPPKKSRTGLYVGGGCGCLLLLACIAGGAFVATSGMFAGPGEEVVSTPITPGQPFTLSYVQSGSQKYKAWLEVDIAYTSGYSLSGTVLLSENNQPFGQYTVAETGSSSAVQERDDATRTSWTSTNVNGSGSASGTVSLFPIPSRGDGSTVTLSGTLAAPAGTTGSIRLIVAKRD